MRLEKTKDLENEKVLPIGARSCACKTRAIALSPAMLFVPEGGSATYAVKLDTLPFGSAGLGVRRGGKLADRAIPGKKAKFMEQ